MDKNVVFLPTENFRDVAQEKNLQLVRMAWRIMFAIDGRITNAELLRKFDLKEAVLDSILCQLNDYGLVTEQQLSLREFEMSLNGSDTMEEERVYEEKEHRALPEVNKPFDLKNVADFIIKAGGDGKVGKLAAHRVFLKISPDIMKKAGISSINEINKNMIIKSDEFKTEIIKAIKSILTMDVPSEIFRM